MLKLKKEKTVEEYKDLYHYVSLITGKLKKNTKQYRYYKSNDAWWISNWLSKNKHIKSFE